MQCEYTHTERERGRVRERERDFFKRAELYGLENQGNILAVHERFADI